MDEFDRAVAERIANLERTVNVKDREVRTLVDALSKHEGYDPDATSFRHLGRTL